MKYRVIGSDFDSTIKSDISGVSDRTIRVIHDFQSRGGHFYICTGRMYSSIKPHAKRLGLHGPISVYQGAEIRDLDTDAVIYENYISTQDAVAALRYIERTPYIVHVYAGDDFYVRCPNKYTDFYMQFCAVEPIYTVVPLSRFVQVNEIRPIKIVVFLASEQLLAFKAEFDSNFSDRLFTSRSQATFMEIVNLTANKGSSLAYLAAQQGIDMSEAIGFGDATNDNPLLEYAGLGVAVENAMTETKAVADRIARSVEDDGVARIIIEECFDTTYEEYFADDITDIDFD